MSRAARTAAQVLALALAIIAICVGGDARAAAPSRVVLLRTAGAETATRQAETLLGAELRAAGFDVREVPRTAGLALRADIESVAAAVRAIATLAIAGVDGDAAPPGPAVELWLSDRLTGKLVVRRVETPSPIDAADLALKAVELLRGSLLEIATAPPPAAALPAEAPPADVARFVARDRAPPRATFADGLGLSLGGAVLGAFSPSGAAVAPALRVSYGVGRWGARLSLLGPSSSANTQLSDGGSVLGTARVYREMALLEALALFRPHSLWQPFLTAGAGPHHARIQGTGGTPLFVGQSDATWGVVVAAGVGLALRLGARAAVTAEIAGTAVLPSTRVLIAGQETARVGGPSALLSLGVVTTF